MILLISVFISMLEACYCVPSYHTLSAPLCCRAIAHKGMLVQWDFAGDTIQFSISAPNNGWLAIGFNEQGELPGTYLLMGRVVNGETHLVEHYILEPGNYKSLVDLETSIAVSEVSGYEQSQSTQISFSLPTQSKTKYAKSLLPGMPYHLTMAYSLSDDFKHHSIMRTSIPIQL